MTKNKLSDLNNHLFAQLDRLGSKDLDDESMEQEVKRTKAIVDVSEQIIDNAKVALSAAELMAKHGVSNWEGVIPEIEGKPKPKGIPDYKNERIK